MSSPNDILKNKRAAVQDSLHAYRGADTEMGRTSALAEAVEALLNMVDVLQTEMDTRPNHDVPMADRIPEGFIVRTGYFD